MQEDRLSEDKSRYSFAFNKKLIKSFDNRCNELNKTRTQVINSLIEQYLDEDITTCSKEKLTRLKTQIKELEDTNNRLDKLYLNIKEENTKLLEQLRKQTIAINELQEQNNSNVSKIASLGNKVVYLENRSLWARLTNKKDYKGLLEG